MLASRDSQSNYAQDIDMCGKNTAFAKKSQAMLRAHWAHWDILKKTLVSLLSYAKVEKCA